MCVPAESTTTSDCGWLLADNIVILLKKKTVDCPTLADPAVYEAVPYSNMTEDAQAICTELQADLTDRNGNLPSLFKCKCALLSLHTRDRMTRRLERREGGPELLQEAWAEIKRELVSVHMDLLTKDDAEAAMATKRRSVTPAPVASPAPSTAMGNARTGRMALDDVSESEDSPQKRQCVEAATPTSEPCESVTTRAERNATEELHQWKERQAPSEFPMMGKLVDSGGKQTHEVFDSVGWWMEPSRWKRYRGMRLVAVSHLVVHATAARCERTWSWAGILSAGRRAGLSALHMKWALFVKRNAHLKPTLKQVVAKYKELFGRE